MNLQMIPFDCRALDTHYRHTVRRTVFVSGLSTLLLLSLGGIAEAQAAETPAATQPSQPEPASPPSDGEPSAARAIPQQASLVWVPAGAAQSTSPQPAGQGGYAASVRPAPIVMLPYGARFGLEFPLINYLTSLSDSRDDSIMLFQLLGGVIDVGYAPSPLVTVGAMFGVSYSEITDLVAEFAGYVDFAPGRSSTRFFFRPHVGGTTFSSGGGWLVGARLGARAALIDHATIEPWVQVRYNSLSASGRGGGPDIGIAMLSFGLSVALWEETTPVLGASTATAERPMQTGSVQSAPAQPTPQTASSPSPPPSAVEPEPPAPVIESSASPPLSEALSQ